MASPNATIYQRYAMLESGLPVEIVVSITKLLPSVDISSLMKCSRHLKDISEQHLYADLVFETRQEKRARRKITLLLIRLLVDARKPGRPQLLEYIQGITLKLSSNMRACAQDEFEDYDVKPLGQDSITKFTRDQPSMWKLIAKKVAGMKDHDLKNWYNHLGSGFDAALAFLMVLAPNLRHIHFDHSPFSKTVFQHTYKLLNYSSTVAHSYRRNPLRELRHFNIIGNRSFMKTPLIIPMSPTLETISLSIVQINDLGPNKEIVVTAEPKLSKFELSSVGIEPDLVQRFLKSGICENLRILKLDTLWVEFKKEPKMKWKNYAYRHLTDILKEHLSHVEDFSLTQDLSRHEYQDDQLLGSLATLTTLKRLRVDFPLLTRLPLIRLTSLLPTSVEYLHLIDIPFCNIAKFLTPEPFYPYGTLEIRMPPFRELFLNTELSGVELEDSGAVLEYLQQRSDRWILQGLDFRIFRRIGAAKAQLMVGPGRTFLKSDDYLHAIRRRTIRWKD